MRKIKNTRKGFSLIEILLVLSIIAALSVIAFKVFNNVKNKQMSNEYIQKLNIVKSNADEIFTSSVNANFDGSSVMMTPSVASQLVSGTGYTKNYNDITGYYMDTNTMISLSMGNLKNNTKLITIGFRFPADICTSFISSLISSNNYLINTMDGTIYGSSSIANVLNQSKGQINMSAYNKKPTISDIANSCATSQKTMEKITPGWNGVNIYIVE